MPGGDDDGGKPARDAAPESSPRKEGGLRRKVRVTREVARNPRRLPTVMRDALVRIWNARGGGFYGFGYLVSFLVLEARLLASEAAASEGVFDFLSGQLLELVFRFAIQSVVNGFMALLWPLFVLDSMGLWGVLFLVAGYVLFEKLARPLLQARFPDLGARRDASD